MRFTDFIEIIICFIILFIGVWFFYQKDKDITKQAIELNKNLNNIKIYHKCYEISDMYYCIKETGE